MASAAARQYPRPHARALLGLRGNRGYCPAYGLIHHQERARRASYSLLFCSVNHVNPCKSICKPIGFTRGVPLGEGACIPFPENAPLTCDRDPLPYHWYLGSMFSISEGGCISSRVYRPRAERELPRKPDGKQEGIQQGIQAPICPSRRGVSHLLLPPDDTLVRLSRGGFNG